MESRRQRRAGYDFPGTGIKMGKGATGMEERIALYERDPGGEERRRGDVSYARQGMYIRFRVRCPAWAGCPAVCKVWLEREERHLLLGTLLPEGAELTLERRISAAELAGRGMEPPECAVACAGEPAGRAGAGRWQSLATLSLHPQDAVVRDCLRQAPDAGEWKPEKDRVLLRFPWRPGRPYPLPPLFCFGRFREGAVYFCLSGQGIPLSAWPETFAGPR